MKFNDRFTLKKLIERISGDLKLVEKGLLSETDPVLSSIQSMNHYIHNSGGKRLRPVLLLYVSKILGGNMETARELAIIVEYVHAATLVHDDVIDASEMRRGRESLNALRRNKEAVLFGDWLHMTSFWKALELEDFQILQVLIKATRQMVEGELLQMEMVSRPDITRETRERITYCKTASLFACCCRLGALCSPADDRTVESFTSFGESLGMAFQLVDDLLDYSSGSESLGKPVLQDLYEGNITLPVICLLEKAGSEERRFIEGVIRKGSPGPEVKKKLLELVSHYGCLEECFETAKGYAEKARGSLEGLPVDDKERILLSRLPEWILGRSY